jgi:hypothetical protein
VRKKTERKPATREPVARKPRATAKPAVTTDLIARRAYELYEQGAGGDMLAHWLQAEAELQGA